MRKVALLLVLGLAGCSWIGLGPKEKPQVIKVQKNPNFEGQYKIWDAVKVCSGSCLSLDADEFCENDKACRWELSKSPRQIKIEKVQ